VLRTRFGLYLEVASETELVCIEFRLEESEDWLVRCWMFLSYSRTVLRRWVPID
jgi:hypothetical protein